MKKCFFIFILFSQSLVSVAQFTDDFSDGDFTNNPTWNGDVSRFDTNITLLHHLLDTVNGESYLSTECKVAFSAIWEFDITLLFDPSTSNYSKIYLMSNKSDLTSNLNGVFVKIGGESGAIDNVSLYTQSGNSTTKIIDGILGIAASNPDLKVKVIRDSIGNWELIVGNPNFPTSQGTAFDTTIISSDYFGVLCKYTKTRSDLFYFDNFNVSGSFLVDTIKPEVTNVQINSASSGLVIFSEPVDSITAVNPANYTLDNGLGNPTNIVFDNQKTVEIFFTNPFVNLTVYLLDINNVQDIAQNNMLPFSINLSYFIPQFNDIVINEIYADPTPSIGLPDVEYIELYNRTNTEIDLTDWTITIGTTEKQFPLSIIEADSFVILIKEDAIDSFPNNISKIGFSSISLTNAGADLILKDNNGKLINAISYTDRWYNNDNKSDGGWSIERVNPNLFCEGKNNWRASVANIGGSPGKANSVFGESVFIDAFRITKAFIIDSNKVQIHFNKNLDSLILVNSVFFEINGNIPIKSTPITPFFSSVNLIFGFDFLANNTYTLTANNLMDCSGNLLSNSMIFGIPDSALENDIIINEILFNPKDDGVDYVEIYNKSDSYFDLKNLRIANFEFSGFENKNIAKNSKVITEETHLFAPKTYLVLSSDSAKVRAQYYCENPYNFIVVESLPTLSNDEGEICIVHQSLNQIIDAFAYHEDMHFSLLETEDGISLERLDVNTKTQNATNWHSAASTVGFGTPTYENSQMYISQSIGEMNIDPKSFTPNNDGNKDVVAIAWNFSKTNLMATIKIFDSKGRLVNNLMNNEMIGNKGSTNWDGTSEDGLQLNTGMYIIWMEVFSENGDVERFKKVVVLSR